jgi:mannose-6-phosphate isomerase-like protein (cupin superfamily)
MKEKAQSFELDDVLARIGNDEYFNDFLHIRHLEAGILRLRPGEEDSQTPHDADELYYVIQGSGYLEVGFEHRVVKKGSIIFVPAKKPHRFYGNKSLLIVLYMFAE